MSGLATVIGLTVNHQQWLPDFAPPYVIANVALADDPSIHLTTNIVDCEPDEVQLGAEVRVLFEHANHDGRGDVWIPLFELTGETDPVDRVIEPTRPTVRLPLTDDRYEHKSIISGIGRSAIGRRLMRNPLSLAVDASLAAIADAGLTPDDIDGIATYPGGMGYEIGFSEGGITAVEEALRLRPTWICGGPEVPGPGGSMLNAMMAVANGLCRHVLCFRTVWQTTAGVLQLGGMGGRAGRRPAMADAVRRAERRELDRHERHAVSPAVRRDPRAVRPRRRQRPPQRGVEPERDLPRTVHARRLLRRTAGHHAVRALRLRRAVRRCDGRDRQRRRRRR